MANRTDTTIGSNPGVAACADGRAALVRVRAALRVVLMICPRKEPQMICPQIDAQTMKPDRFPPGSHLTRWALSVVIVLRHCMQRLRNEAAAHPPDFTAPCFQFAVEGAGIVTVEPREGDPSSIGPSRPPRATSSISLRSLFGSSDRKASAARALRAPGPAHLLPPIRRNEPGSRLAPGIAMPQCCAGR
jgi:hypothetical protein